MNIRKLRLMTAGLGLTAFAAIAMSADRVKADEKNAQQLPTKVIENVVKSDLEYLQKVLEKTPEKRAIPTIKASAIITASLANDGLKGADGDKLANIRAGAIKIAEAVAKKDFAEAKKAVESFKDAKGEKTEMDISKQAKIDINEIMSAFRKSTAGGRNLEADLKEHAKKITDASAAAQTAARISAIAAVSESMAPKGATEEKLKQWQGWSKEMKSYGVSAAVELSNEKVDDKKVKDLMAKLQKTCTDCHAVFRD